MKLGKREVEKVMATSKAQSIVSSRKTSRMSSRRDSRQGSMDMEDDSAMQKIEESKQISQPRTEGGKIINKLSKGEERDSAQTEQVPDPFAAEQTYITEDEIQLAQKQRKGSYDQMDQEMGGPEPSSTTQTRSAFDQS